jgi:hypothetical protein
MAGFLGIPEGPKDKMHGVNGRSDVGVSTKSRFQINRPGIWFAKRSDSSYLGSSGGQRPTKKVQLHFSLASNKCHRYICHFETQFLIYLSTLAKKLWKPAETLNKYWSQSKARRIRGAFIIFPILTVERRVLKGLKYLESQSDLFF